MSINPIKQATKIWIRGMLKSSRDWYYIGHPLEIHPDKMIFHSNHEICSPVVLKIGKFNLAFDKELKQLTSYGKEGYYYQLEFSSYYQCLTFMFSWCKSLGEDELYDILNSRKFTRFFNIDDLSFLLEQINDIEVSGDQWKQFVDAFIEQWSLQGLELIDTDYESRVFSHKKTNAGLPDLSINVDLAKRYKLKAWGEINENTKQEMYVICYFLASILNKTYSSIPTPVDNISDGKKVIQNKERKYKIIGNSDNIKKMRSTINFHKTNNGHVWIKGPFGCGKTLLANVISEEFGKGQECENHYIFSLYNQKKLLDQIEEECFKDDSERVVILDKMHLLEESYDILLQKIVKKAKGVKFIFVSDKDAPAYFEGEIISLLPLKERQEDLSVLTDYLLAEICREKSIPVKKISEVFLKKMKVYKWPGNIAELKNFLTGLVDYHYFDHNIEYRNEDHHHQCDPYQKQLFRFEEIKNHSDFSGAYWKEKILKAS